MKGKFFLLAVGILAFTSTNYAETRQKHHRYYQTVTEKTYPVKKLSPHIRTTDLSHDQPVISLNTVKPFLELSQVLETNDFEKSPIIVGNASRTFVAMAGDKIFVEGIPNNQFTTFSIVIQGSPYIDPITKEVLGYAALYVGEARLLDLGVPATVIKKTRKYTPATPASLVITKSKREIQNGFLLLPIDKNQINSSFLPKAPSIPVNGQIISVFDGVTQIGENQVVVINRGTRENIEVGDMLIVERKAEPIQDPRDRHITLNLPNTELGEVMVFRTFSRVSLALVTRASNVIHVLDQITNP